MTELEKLYIVRNEAAKTGNIETVNNITEELNNLYPVKPKSVLCIDGKPVQFEIIGATESAGKGFSNGLFDESFKITQPLVNGKRMYSRLLIKKVV